MRDWLNSTLNIIHTLNYTTVLEIGCGTGMLCLNLFKRSKRYIATDISKEALNIIAKNVNKDRKVRLLKQDASDFTGLSEYYFDLIIVNSVTQYFPSGQYLSDFLDSAIEHVTDGSLFIGDVRNFGLEQEYYKLLVAKQLKYKPTICDFHKMVEHYKEQEKELLIHPNYFIKKATQNDKIKGVNIFLKPVKSANELGLFRYDVVYHTGNSKVQEINVDFESLEEKSIEQIIQKLKRSNQNVIGIQGIRDRNRYILDSIDIWLQQKERNIIFDDFLNGLDEFSEISMSELSETANHFGYRAYFLLTNNFVKGFYDVVFIKHKYIDKKVNIFIKRSLEFEKKDLNLDLYNNPLIRFLDIQKIRSALQQRLPDYSIPHEIRLTSKMPMTISGKVDYKKLLGQIIGLVETTSNYQIPVTHNELLISSIWSEYLGRNDIGANDNFFDLGGDSISSIMIVSRLSQAGFDVLPKDIFKHQTISKLAKFLQTKTNSNKYVLPIGNLVLSPIQSWFFSKDMKDYNKWQYGFTLNATKKLDYTKLRRAIDIVVNVHDTFKLKFNKFESEWMQLYSLNGELYNLEEIECTGDSNSKQQVNEYIGNLLNRINLNHGPLIQFLLVKKKNIDQLIVISHHLVMDGISMRILINDIETAYMQEGIHLNVTIFPKTLPYSDWAKLYQDKIHTLSKEELKYFVTRNKCQIPLRFPGFVGGLYHQDYLVIERQFDISKLSNALNNVQVLSVILAALGLSITDSLGVESILFLLEQQTRDIFDEYNFSRTIGWFVSLVPFLFINEEVDTLLAYDNTFEYIKNIKRISYIYDSIKYNSTSKEAKKSIALFGEPRILFNFHGNIDFIGNKLFEFEKIISNDLYDQSYITPYLLEINTYISRGRLCLSLRYNKNYSNSFDIETVFTLFVSTLENVQDKVLNRLSLEESPLSVMQKTLMNVNSSIDIGNRFHTTEIEVKGKLDFLKLESIWKTLHENMDIFSLSILNDEGEVPYISMRNDIKVDFKVYDLTGSINQGSRKYSDYISQEKNLPFNIRKAPLIRMRAIKISNHRSIVIITYHQLVLDGWSLNILIEAIFSNLSILTPKSFMYPQFLGWVRAVDANFDIDASRKYWRKDLLSYNIEQSRLLPFMKNISNLSADTYAYFKHNLSEEDTMNLKLAARELRVSLNTVAQALWSLVHSTIIGKDKVVFGVMASGRDKIAQNDRDFTVGLCTHIVPLSCSIKTELSIREYCQILQERFQNSHSNSGMSLQEILTNSRNSKECSSEIDFVIAFQNFAQIRLPKTFGNFIINNIISHVYANFPMTLRIIPGDKMELNMCYDGNMVDGAKVKTMINSYIRLLKSFSVSSKQSLEELTNLLK